MLIFFYTPKKYLDEKEVWNRAVELIESLEIEGITLIKEIINLLKTSSIEELLVEYTRLFIGSTEYIAPPYASFYIEGRLMGDSAVKTLEFYKKAGLDLKEDFTELPDHIAVEFEFMSYLISQEVKSLYEKNFEQADKFHQLQREFLDNYLIIWIPAFCNKIKKGTQNKFYYLLAEFLQSFINAQKI
ncbi:MAG: molecular chaperone [Caldimicrobium sp.]